MNEQTVNVWGTPVEDVDSEGFCPNCERENNQFGYRQHYTNCPNYVGSERK